MERAPDKSPLLWLFVLLSLLVHLAVLYLIPVSSPRTAPPRPPLLVEMREPEQPREIEAPVAKPTAPKETPAKRLGPQDQRVEKEKAPKGEEVEDRAPRPVPPPAVPKQTAPEPRPEAEAAPEAQSAPPLHETEEPASAAPQPPARPAVRTRQELLPRPQPQTRPSLENLLALAPATLERELEGLRQKYRKEVEEGDAVWLDMEKDLLHSFFQRFRNNVYAVWNYPLSARERGHEGTALLQVLINRAGEVENVKLMESSGWPELDREAIEAVYKGAPYGNLPRAYQKEDLTVFAFFQYRLRGRAIF